MVDTESIRRLRKHSNLLTIAIILLIGFLFLYKKKKSTTNNFKDQEYMKVKVLNGATIRSIPSTRGEAIYVIPQNTNLRVIQHHVKDDTIANQTGVWKKIEYNGKVGYVWGDLLE